MDKYPKAVGEIISSFKKLPGVGRKSAERFAFALLGWPNQDVDKLAESLKGLQSDIAKCSRCRCFTREGKCPFCQDPLRDQKAVCVIASPKDVYAIEQTKQFRGLYFVLEGLISPTLDRQVERVGLDLLLERASELQEVIIALDATLEGEATAFYIKHKLAGKEIIVSRLPCGLPLGSSLDFIDEGTLSRALAGRQPC